MLRRVCAVTVLAVLLVGCGQSGVAQHHRAFAAKQVWCPSHRILAPSGAFQNAELRYIRHRYAKRAQYVAALIRDARREWRREANIQSFDASRLVGWDARKAESFVERHGCMWRVVQRNGIAFVLTSDLRFDRVNFDTNNGRVTGVAVY